MSIMMLIPVRRTRAFAVKRWATNTGSQLREKARINRWTEVLAKSGSRQEGNIYLAHFMVSCGGLVRHAVSHYGAV